MFCIHGYMGPLSVVIQTTPYKTDFFYIYTRGYQDQTKALKIKNKKIEKNDTLLNSSLCHAVEVWR